MPNYSPDQLRVIASRASLAKMPRAEMLSLLRQIHDELFPVENPLKDWDSSTADEIGRMFHERG